MTTVPTFNRWLMQQMKRNDPVADLALDARNDKDWPHLNTNPSLRDLAHYLHYSHGVSFWDHDGAMAALIRGYREWQGLGGRYRDPKRPIGRVQTRVRYIPPRARFLIFKRDNYRCQLCGRSAQEHGVVLEIDHKIAFVHGGSNEPTNLWTLCFECNRGKRDESL